VKLNLMSMFHNEAPYLREWIEFHRMMGVETFYLYNRLSTDNWQPVLQPYIDSGVVVLTDWPHQRLYQGTREAFIDSHQHCIDRLRDRHEWLAMIDCDEFLFSPRRERVIDAIAELPEQWGAIGAHWMVFGAGDETAYRDAPAIERFTWRPQEANYFNRWYKSIVRTDDPELRTKGSTHTYHTANGTHNEWGHGLPDNEHDHTSLLLRVNHYFTKSRPEWEERHPLIEDGIPYARDERRWRDVQERNVDDRTIQRFLPALKERLK
jgi:hypothetical protein